MSKTKIIVLIGGTATGKDTIKNALMATQKYHSVVSYTSRPMRLDEINHQTYHFINDEEMDLLLNSKSLLESTEYLVDGKKFRYCLTKECFSDEKDNIVIINPIGLKQIVKNDPSIIERLHVFYIQCYKDIVYKRYMDREKNCKDHDALERRFQDRMLQDQKDFADLETFLKENEIKHNVILNLLTEKTLPKIKTNLALNGNLIGKKIRIIEMQGEPSYTNRIGTIEKIDAMKQLHGTWGGLAIVPKVDLFEEV